VRAAALRAMTLLPKERKRTTIVREGEPAILNFEPIKNFAVSLRWFRSGRAPPRGGPCTAPSPSAELSQWRGRAFDLRRDLS